MSLKENDIRPSDLDEGKLKALKEDLERLYSKQDKFVEVNCPACFSSDSFFEFKNMDSNLKDVRTVKLFL